jgi:STE24 endopeptidase
MHQIVFYIIIGILIFEYLFEQFLELLNSVRRNDKLPEIFIGIYPEDKYKKSQAYENSNYKFSIVKSSFDLIIVLLFLFLSGFAYVNQLALSVSTNPIIISLVFFGIILFASDIVNIPFSLYDTFIIEEKFGFNKMTFNTYLFDKLKGWLLMIIIGGGLLSLFVWFYYWAGYLFWLYAWITASFFMLLMTMFYTSLIVPLFNKLKPLEDGELKEMITAFCLNVGFKLNNVFVIDGSKRSTKANAFFSGIGSKKKIVLYDTLIENLTKEEIVAVLAHEIGHYKKKHTFIGLINSMVQTGLTLYILSLFVGNPDLSKALGVDTPGFHIGLIAFGILYSPISSIIAIFMNIISRINEYSADKYASIHSKGEWLKQALIKLSINNLSNLTPHPLYVFINYSHPTLLQRINKIDKIAK